VIFLLFISLAARFPYVGSGVTRNYVQIFQLISGAKKAAKHPFIVIFWCSPCS